MRRHAMTGLALAVTLTISACSSSGGGDEDQPGGITRIDGPAQVDRDAVVGNGSTDG
ncbi:MAG: hypothetical protein AB8G26_07885 [Ilumatobacter sp.]